MGRLANDAMTSRRNARATSVRNQERARAAEKQRKKDEAIAFQRQQALQAQAASEQERQLIMQANLSAQTQAGQMYAQQQYGRDDARAAMAQDLQIRQRNKIAGIKAGNAQEHAARQQQYRTQELNQDQARMQAERDQQLHGYGQQDASQANDFNRGMANLNNSNMMGRDARLHGYGQQDSAQAQQYGVQNATTAYDRAVDGANLQNRFNQEAAGRQQLYGRENAQMSHQIGMARDQNSYQLDQFGENAQQFRGQEDAIAQQGRGRSDMMYANNVERGNALEERNTRLIDEGWTFTRSQQAQLEEFDKEENIVAAELRGHRISQTEAESQMDEISANRRGVTPTQKPVKRDTGKIHAEQTWTDKNTGVTYNVIEGKPSSVAYDPRQHQSGRSSGGNQGSFQPDGELTFDADTKMRSDVSKAYLDYRKNEMMMSTDGTTPKIKSQREWLKEQIPFMNPHVQRIYQGVLQSLETPLPGNNPEWFQNMTSEPPTPSPPPPTPTPYSQGQGFSQQVPGSTTPEIDAINAGMTIPQGPMTAGPTVDPTASVRGTAQWRSSNGPPTDDELSQEIRLKAQETHRQISEFDQGIDVRRAVNNYGSEASAAVSELKEAMVKAVEYMESGKTVASANPTLYKRIRDLKNSIEHMATNPRQTFQTGY